MEFLIIGIVSAINLIIIKIKFEKGRIEDAVFDLSMMGLLGFMFAGSYGGMVVAMVASMSISIFLFISPPRFTGKIFGVLKKEIDLAKKVNERNS